jgi:hypothetical protein
MYKYHNNGIRKFLIPRVLVPKGFMLSDTFTHSVVDFVAGKRVLVGQLSVCEQLASTNHRYIVGVLRAPLREPARKALQ